MKSVVKIFIIVWSEITIFYRLNQALFQECKTYKVIIVLADLAKELGIHVKQLSFIVRKAKKLHREGRFPVEEFKEIKINSESGQIMELGPCSGVELVWSNGKIISFSKVECKSIPVIPRKSNSTKENIYDREIYKNRHLVENVFARLKHFRSIATRYDKLKKNFEGMLSLACAYVWLKL